MIRIANEWVDAWKFTSYQVNLMTGELKNKKRKKPLKPTIKINQDGSISEKQYCLTVGGKSYRVTGARIVAQTYYQDDLDGYICCFKSHCKLDTSINNIVVKRGKSNGGLVSKYRYLVKINGKIKDSYTNIRAFEENTGISHNTLKRHNYSYRVGQYVYERVER